MSKNAFIPGILIGLMIGVPVAFMICLSLEDSINKISAIRHHAAHYDVQTGAFTWNEPEDK